MQAGQAAAGETGGEARHPQDAQGIYFGGNDMLLTPRQMVSIGEMWLHRGLVKGRQVVPAAWTRAGVLSSQPPISSSSGFTPRASRPKVLAARARSRWLVS